MHGGLMAHWIACSVDNLKAVFLDDGVGEHFPGNAFELFLRFVAAPAVQMQDKKLTLADILYSSIAETGEGVLDGLSLWIKNGAFWQYPDVCCHCVSIASPPRGLCLLRFPGGRKGVLEGEVD